MRWYDLYFVPTPTEKRMVLDKANEQFRQALMLRMSKKGLPWWYAKKFYQHLPNYLQYKKVTPAAYRRWIFTGPRKLLYFPVPEGLELLEHQKRAVEWLSWHYGLPLFNGSVIADDMGLGKTISAIVFANLFKPRLIIIVAPAHLLYNWSYEIDKWQTLNYDIRILKSPKDTIDIGEEKNQFIIVSYDSLARRLEFNGGDASKTLIIADEAHYIKNTRTKRFQHFKELHRAVHVSGYSWTILLSGTPMTNYADDLFYLWDLIVKDKYKTDVKTYYQWRLRYTEMEEVYIRRQDRTVSNVVGSKNLDELNLRLDSFLLRRTKKIMHNELPEKFVQFVHINIPSKISQKYERLLKEVEQLGFQKAYKNAPMHVIEEIGIRKIDTAMGLIIDQIENGEKVVVWVVNHAVGELLLQRLKKHNIKAVYLNSKTSRKQKDDAVRAFQNGDLQVIIAGLRALNTGVTLTAARVAIFVQIDFTPSVMQQAEDRIYRKGQTRDVHIYYIVAAGTREEEIIHRLRQKKAEFQRALS